MSFGQGVRIPRGKCNDSNKTLWSKTSRAHFLWWASSATDKQTCQNDAFNSVIGWLTLNIFYVYCSRFAPASFSESFRNLSISFCTMASSSQKCRFKLQIRAYAISLWQVSWGKSPPVLFRPKRFLDFCTSTLACHLLPATFKDSYQLGKEVQSVKSFFISKELVSYLLRPKPSGLPAANFRRWSQLLQSFPCLWHSIPLFSKKTQMYTV